MAKGTRKVFKMKRGVSSEAPLHAVIRDDVQTGYTPYIRSAVINVGADVGDYSFDISFGHDVSFMGGEIAVAYENDGDEISLLLAPGLLNQYIVDHVFLRGFSGTVRDVELGNMKQGGSLIQQGVVIRSTYHRKTAGTAFKFAPIMEFSI